MGYNILRFKIQDTIRWGILKGDKVVPFAEGIFELKDILTETNLQVAHSIVKEKTSGSISLSDIEIMSSVTQPTRLLALGVNYTEHREEAGTENNNSTVFFRKDESAITSAFGDIQWPKGSQLLDYEVEMGIVIKKEICSSKVINSENIGDYVAGIVLVNDMSPRDLQLGGPFNQWYKGKSYRTMCPIGPYIYIYEPGEVETMHNMQLKLWVNDELRQNVHTSLMITKPEEALTLASEFVDLKPGDVVLTGTPGGVALKSPSKAFV